MITHCPRCQSDRIGQRHLGRRTLGLVGTALGVGCVVALQHDPVTRWGGCAFVPPGFTLKALPAAVAGGLAGGSAGVRLGQFMDDQVLLNYQCLTCGHAFGFFTQDDTGQA